MIDGLLLIPPGMLLLVLLLYRFTGCSYTSPTTGTPQPFAYWRLNEPDTTLSGGTAADTKGQHNGTYRALTGPPQVDPESAFPAEPLAGVLPGGFRCGQESQVQSTGSSSVRFNGGYVKVFDLNPTIQDELHPAGNFSITAWVVPESPVAPGDKSFRSLLTLRSDNLASKGYMIYMGPDLSNPSDPGYYWQVWVGTGDLNWGSRLIGPAVDFGGPDSTPVTFVAVTYNATTRELKLYVNPDDDGTPAATLALANPMLRSHEAPLYIGAGKTNVPDQPQPAPGPQYFFRGLIQEVRLFDVELTGGPAGEVLTYQGFDAFGE